MSIVFNDVGSSILVFKAGRRESVEIPCEVSRYCLCPSLGKIRQVLLDKFSPETVVFADEKQGRARYFSVKKEDLAPLGLPDRCIQRICHLKDPQERWKSLKYELFAVNYPIFKPYIDVYASKVENLAQAEAAYEIYQKANVKSVDELVRLLKSPGMNNYKFVRTLASNLRRLLAEEQNPEDLRYAALFGTLRQYSVGGCFRTPLGGCYKLYGEFLTRKIEELIQGKSDQELQEGFIIQDSEQDVSGQHFLSSSILVRKVSSSVLLQGVQGRMLVSLEVIREAVGAFDAFVATIFISDGRDSIELSQYIQPIPIEDLRLKINWYLIGPLLQGHTDPYIIHTEPIHFERLESLIDTQFSRCLLENNPEALKKEVAIFRYLFAQESRYRRGSALIGEWMERALYKYHGFEFTYKYPVKNGIKYNPSGDLDAFTQLLLGDYIRDYLAKAHLTRL